MIRAAHSHKLWVYTWGVSTAALSTMLSALGGRLPWTPGVDSIDRLPNKCAMRW